MCPRGLSLTGQGYLVERHSETCMVDMGILFSNMKSPSHELYWHSDPLPVTVTFQLIRLSTNFMTLIPSLTFTELRIVSMENLQTDMACQEGTLTLPDTLHMPNSWDQFWLFSTSYLEYLSVLSRFCLGRRHQLRNFGNPVKVYLWRFEFKIWNGQLSVYCKTHLKSPICKDNHIKSYKTFWQ